MRPFDQAWRILKFTSGLPGSQNFKDKRTAATVREAMDAPMAHLRQAASGGYSQLKYSDSQPELQPRPTEFENRQFNVKTIEDEDTRGRVRDTYNELEPANFSTGDEMNRRIKHAKGLESKTGRPNRFANFRATENYPALTEDEMPRNLRYPFRSKLEGNPSQFTEEDNFPIDSEIE